MGVNEKISLFCSWAQRPQELLRARLKIRVGRGLPAWKRRAETPGRGGPVETGLGGRGPWGWREQQGPSGREPLTDALSGPVASVICGFSAKKEPQSSATLRPLQAWNKAAESAGSPMAPLLDRGLCSPGAHVGCSGRRLTRPGDGPSTGTPPPSTGCHRDPLPGACLQNGDGAPGHPSPCRARLKCQPQRTGHRRACPGTRAKCWHGMMAGAELVKCLLGTVQVDTLRPRGQLASGTGPFYPPPQGTARVQTHPRWA